MSRITLHAQKTSDRGLTELADADMFLLDGTNGSRKISAKDLANAMQDMLLKNSGDGICSKNGVYRGANLGSGTTFAEASTAAQRAAISNGTFEGLFIGDYWTVNGRVYRIADFNYWLRVGDTDFNTNHIVLVPDASFGTDKMNDTNTTEGGYFGSYMYTDESSVLNAARNTISNDFSGYLATHRIYLCNAVSSGIESGGAWYNSTVDLMSEIMVYGTKILNTGFLTTVEKSQLALFRLCPEFVNTRYSYWLKDVVSATNFAYFSDQGIAYSLNASNSRGVRPVFAVKGTTT